MNWKKIINLSPLVDVLMIVIFWYIMMSNQTLEENKQTAEEERNALMTRYEQALSEQQAQNDALTQEVERLLAEAEQLLQSQEELRAETELRRQINEELSSQLSDLREENEALGLLLEQSVGYVYIRLYDGLNANRIVEINSEAELVDKFIFSKEESEYLEQKLTKVITEYATKEEKQRIAVVFLYEGSNAYYVDITRILNVLNTMRAEHGIAVLTINLAE